MKKAIAIGLGAALLAAIGPRAEAAEDFFKDKTIKIICAGNVGAGYDLQARIVARHLGKHIPGNPNVIVQNMAAGAGYAAPNHVFNAAEKDGTVIGLFNRATLFGPLLGEDVAQFKVEQFNWLGSPASYQTNAYVFMIRGALPYKTFEELRTLDKPLIVGTANSIHVNITEEALGAKLKLIGGYQSTELDMAFERGEVDAQGTSYANLAAFTPQWLTNNMVRILVQFGSGKRIPELKDVPTAGELARNADDKALVALSELALTLGFPMAMPPGVPADRIEILRAAFKATMADPEFIADGERSKMEYSPKYHDALAADIKTIAGTPAAIADRYKKVTKGLGR